LSRSYLVNTVFVAALSLPATAFASGFTIGSGNTAVIEPAVAHPAEAPCVVPLYADAVFGANNIDYNYAPPPDCPGPWAKVILKVEIGLDKGIQYDRSGLIFLGGVNIWFGTTSEPNPNLGPKWHIERDVTDDTALLLKPQTGFVQIANYTNSTDNSVITSSAQLLFYPATSAYPVPAVPDMVIGLGGQGGPAILNSGLSKVSVPLTLPKNVIGAKLDLFLQGQHDDEFWYSCVPNRLTSPLESCGNGAFREGEVEIDKTPAGVAPVYPWVFTGGFDPYLWAPLPGVQTLNFKPFRVELTPFAALLDDGKTHSLSLSVHDADQYFSVTGALYVYLDHGARVVTGAVTQNTLTAQPSPTTIVSPTTNSVTVVNTNSTRDFSITGYVMSSAGRVTTTLHETSDFYNDQIFDIPGPLYYSQKIKQDTETLVDVKQATLTSSSETSTQYSYPLTVNYLYTVNPDGSSQQTTSFDQEYHSNSVVSANGLPVGEYDLVDAITPTDTLLISAAGYLTGNTNQSSTNVYSTTGTGEGCFTRTLAAAANVLTSATTSGSCK